MFSILPMERYHFMLSLPLSLFFFGVQNTCPADCSDTLHCACAAIFHVSMSWTWNELVCVAQSGSRPSCRAAVWSRPWVMSMHLCLKDRRAQAAGRPGAGGPRAGPQGAGRPRAGPQAAPLGRQTSRQAGRQVQLYQVSHPRQLYQGSRASKGQGHASDDNDR